MQCSSSSQLLSGAQAKVGDTSGSSSGSGSSEDEEEEAEEAEEESSEEEISEIKQKPKLTKKTVTGVDRLMQIAEKE